MPNKKKKTNAKSKRPKQPPRLTKTNRAGNVASAPAAQSGFRKTSVTFSKGTTGGSLVMTSTAALYNIGAVATGVLAAGLQNGSAVYGYSAQLNLTSPGGIDSAGAAVAMPAISPQWDLIASCFARYRVLGCEFEYYPQCSTSNPARLVFAYSSDPIHPLLFDATPTVAEIESVADSIPFSPWAAWKMNVTSKVSKEWFYTYDGLAVAAPSSVNSYVERFASFGIVACACSNAAAAEIDGLLYLTLKVEFCEFNPISVTRPSLLERLHRKITLQAKERSKRTNGLDKDKTPQLAQLAENCQDECNVSRWNSSLEREVMVHSSSTTHQGETVESERSKGEEETMEDFLARKTDAFERKMRAELAERWNCSFASKGKSKVVPNTRGSIEISGEPEITNDDLEVDERDFRAPKVDPSRVGLGGPVSPPSPTIDSLSDSELGKEFVRRRLAARARDSDPGSTRLDVL